MTLDQIVSRFAQVAPKAARGRRWAPGLIRRRTMPQPQLVAGREESWTIGYLIDVILTRDPMTCLALTAGFLTALLRFVAGMLAPFVRFPQS